MTEHWLDRLATAPHTRRRNLRGIAALLAALTVPAGRAAGAGNADCRKGCLYVNQRETADRFDRCRSNAIALADQGIALTLFGSLPLGFAYEGAGIISRIRCDDATLLASKAAAYDCLQPGCSGFDPTRGKYGPCANCATIAGCQCCPSAKSTSGYTYCDATVGYRCGPDGDCVSTG